MSGLSLRTCLPNLKFVPSAVLEQTDRQTDRQTGTGLSETTAWLMVIAGHRTPDTGHHDCANDFIFCPMLLCSALDRQKTKGSRFYGTRCIIVNNTIMIVNTEPPGLVLFLFFFFSSTLVGSLLSVVDVSCCVADVTDRQLQRGCCSELFWTLTAVQFVCRFFSDVSVFRCRLSTCFILTASLCIFVVAELITDCDPIHCLDVVVVDER